MISFSFEIEKDGGRLSLTEISKKLFRTSELQLTLSEWDKLSDFGQVDALGKIRSAEQEDNGTCNELADGTGYFLSHDFISGLSDYHSRALNLPVTFPYQVDIKTSNNIGSPNFAISWTVFRRGKPLKINRQGCFAFKGDKPYRLPKELYEVIECIDSFHAISVPTFDQKTKFIAELKTLLPQNPDGNLIFEGELEKISLQHASAMSLQITGDKNSINFNPVLFHKNIMTKASELQEAIDESEQIFSLAEARNFSATFKNTEEVKPTYLLGKAKYVFIDEALRPALKAVKLAANLPRENRIDFAKSPQKYIKSMFEKELSGLSDIEREIQSLQIDEIFIETIQFSERVTEMGIWKAPDLPWLKPEPKEWRSDSYSFFVHGKLIIFPIGDLETVIEQLQTAIETGKPSIKIGTEEIIPDPDLLATLESLTTKRPDRPDPLKQNTDTDTDSDTNSDSDSDTSEPTENVGPIVPLTKENFEVVEYNLKFKLRLEELDDRPPERLKPNVTLKAHQQTGVSWLVETYNRGYPGVLMADDMGLGKTLQALSFLAIMVKTRKIDEETKKIDEKTREKGKRKPLLIVAPVGLLKNWEEEHEKHLSSPGLGCLAKLYGNSLKKFKTGKGRDIDVGTAILDADKIRGFDWLLTTYETLRDYQESFAQIKFSCVVFDELQKAKNPRSLLSQGTKVLNADFSIGLTGTPVENSLADLWTIMDILSPGRLGDLKGFLKEYPETNTNSPEAGVAKLKGLSKKLLKEIEKYPPPVLRRMKTELKDGDLPEKRLIPSNETTLPMPTIQEDAYSDISNRLNSKSIKMIDALHQFRTISRSPISAEQIGQFSVDDFIDASARLQVTFNTLDEIYQKQEKVLLFVESRTLQPVLASIIKQKYKMTSQPLIINGLISGDARQRKVNEFQEGADGFDAIIISPKAGGVGLTLTAANNVIHVERWWNPAVEDQCTDRAYRIGQNKPVSVYTPIARSTSYGDKSFDCILDKLLQKKRSLATDVFMSTQIESDDFASAFAESKSQKLLNLDEIDCLEKGSDFENAVIDIIRVAGLTANHTQTSYDYGADIIVRNEATKKSAIVQCKHKADITKNINESAAQEVLNARGHYEMDSPLLVVVTNAISATSKCSELCRENNMRLVARDELLEIGQILAHDLS